MTGLSGVFIKNIFQKAGGLQSGKKSKILLSANILALVLQFMKKNILIQILWKISCHTILVTFASHLKKFHSILRF